MSAVLDSEQKVSDISMKSDAVEIREGDWKAYLQSIRRGQADQGVIGRYGNVMEYKRACALAYLGKRAQLRGGVCSTRHPHIMTPQFIADLEVSNRAIRYTRYPWLKSFISLLGEIEQIQDQISTSNVITLVPAGK